MGDYKILVNASNLRIGGGVQVGVSFIEYIFSLTSSPFEFLILVSKQVFENLRYLEKEQMKSIILIADSPADLFSGLKVRRKIKYIENLFKPDLVYNIGHPTYIKFDSVTLARYTGGWEICDSGMAFKKLSLNEKIKRVLRTKYRLFWAKYADFFETQTETAKRGICNILKVPEENVRVFPNTVNQRFLNYIDSTYFKDISKKKKIIIFSLAAPYKHKNLEIIPKIARELKNIDPNRNYKFVLTLPEDNKLWLSIRRTANYLGVTNMVENAGSLNLDQCIELYKRSDILFLPTLFEIFSVTYLEAMAMGVPIITTDLDFSREICGNAALYFSPLSHKDAAFKIVNLVSNSNLYNSMIIKGKKRIKTFPTPEEKNEEILNWIKDIINRTKREKVETANPKL